jgi:hypothetical protein
MLKNHQMTAKLRIDSKILPPQRKASFKKLVE